MVTFIATIFVFSLVILIHEFGHYKVAQSVGIKIEEFAIGMGPIIYKKIKNETVYSIRLLPIGGFVRMEGEEEDVQSSTSYNCKTVWQRFKVIAAGPIMNFVLAIIIFIIISFGFGVLGNTVNQMDENSEIYKAGIRPNDKIVSINGDKVYIWDEIIYDLLEKTSENLETPLDIKVERDKETLDFRVNQYTRNIIGIYSKSEQFETSIVETKDKQSPAYKAGIRTNDEIIKINNIDISNFEDIRLAINALNEDKLNITVKRDGQELKFEVVPKKVAQLGFNTHVEKSFITTVASSFYKTGYYIRLMFEFIGNLFGGHVKEGSVGGPIQIVSMIGETSKLGIYPLLNLVALLSINLGFFNLLPIPALDGSKLVFLIIEKIRGKKIPIEKEGFVHFVGFVLLITLMIFVTYKDVVRLF
ncbi:RIP metalloprotease RseP [Sedimentibacter sp. zth1]|uniref:RIP metalloprotease RseP n=1 Tax=Sedimentibacter sp. zth1 TaxID=2816908 RepID=UPI001A93446A|nr:RIP metalloprotease RseP [Sedimentibacter sp. zth1]QSX06552.1 RIP metalloprotease RseP [Sedimentibacter sp. zth1]